MKQNLIVNLIPFELSFDKIKVYYAENEPDDSKIRCNTIPYKFLKPSDEYKSNKLIYWNVSKFSDSKLIEIHKNDKNTVKLFNRASQELIKKALKKYFQNKNFIIGDNFIGNITVLENMQNTSTQDLIQYKKINIRIIPPFQQYLCHEGNMWCLNISYNGRVEVTKKPLNNYGNHNAIKKVVINNVIKHINELSEQELKSPQTKIIVSNAFRQKQGWPLNSYKSKNKYFDFYKETLQFYETYLKGKDIFVNENHDKISISKSGFQKINENNIVYPEENSNLLLFAENKTHFNSYYGLKEYGPYRSNVNKYKFFFIFHKEDKELANKLYNYLTKGMKGFPGLFQFIGLELILDRDKTINFVEQENPIEEIESQLNKLKFEANVQYLAVYYFSYKQK